MYVPPHFQQDDPEAIRQVIERSRLGTLVTIGSEGLLVSHLPIMLDRQAPGNGSLLCHVARANPQWQHVTPQTEALAIFMDCDAYVSPSWYQTKRETGKVVPTWNYIAVHAYGPIHLIEDPPRLHALVARLTQLHEGRRAEPWAITDAPASYIEQQLRGIVGIQIPIARFEAKWKLSQNRPEGDVCNVVNGLLQSGDIRDRETGDAMSSAFQRLREH